MADLNEVLSRVRHRLSRGGLWSRGGEPGTLTPGEFDARGFRILIARLSSYENTSLSFTHDILYSLFADRLWYPDWAFFPSAQDREVFAANGIPWLFGIQSKRTVRDFGVVAVSNSISQETANLFWLLKNSGIPLEKSERMADEGLPLIILGGANAGSSNILFHPDPLVDGIFVGEDFDAIGRLFALVAEGREKGIPKRAILESLEGVDGFFQPDRLKPVRKLNARTLVPSALYAKMPVNYGEGNPGKAVLAISEGCAGFCSFCNESFVRKPYREASVESLLAEARLLKAETGADKIDLFSFNFNMHQGFYDLIEGLIPLFREIGLKSQRFDSIAEDPALIEVEKALGKSVFTCGLEGISGRLRCFLNKNLSDGQVRKSVEVLVSSSVREIKVFLIATGREEDPDFAEWERFLTWAQGLHTPQGKQVRFVFSVTPLVHFPHTPLEFEPTPSPEAFRLIIGRIVSLTQKLGFECRQAASVEESLFCDHLLRADRPEIFEAFREAVLETGFLYEREISPLVYRTLLEKLSARGLDPETLRRDFSSEKNAVAPWALLDLGVTRGYLERQYEKNSAYLQAEPDPAVLCGRGRKKPGMAKIEALKQKIAAGKKDEAVIEFPCSLGERWNNLPREYPALHVASALMKADPSLVAPYRGFASSFWQAEPERPVPLWGRDTLSLRFRIAALPYVASLKTDFWERVNAGLAAYAISVEKAGSRPDASFSLRMESPFDLNPDYFLKGGLKHVYMKTAESRFSYQLTKEALKKNILRSLDVDKSVAGVFSVSLVPGDKFDLEDFLQNAFRKQEKNGWQRIRVEAR